MKDKSLQPLLHGLRTVESSHDFKSWVRHELRAAFPHAAFLATLGKLYGVGSVPTHRLDVDFPLRMIEDLKNSAGALDDPTLHAWFRNQRLRYVDVLRIDEAGGQRNWRRTLLSYGIRSVTTHGVLDHGKRRFAVFQICNIFVDISPVAATLLATINAGMAEAAWAAIDQRSANLARDLVGHPTLSLTPTELHIIELLAQGLSNKEIARLRGVSDSTIKTQVQRTGAKLGATRRAEIVAIAMPMLSPLPAQTIIDYGSDRFGSDDKESGWLSGVP